MTEVMDKHRRASTSSSIVLLARLDTPLDVLYYRHGGILPYVTRMSLKA